MHKLTKLELGEYFHIYNRGNNRELLFIEHENYMYFLKLFAKHLNPILHLYAYSKSFNSYFKRRGSLFQERFGRIKIDSEEYFSQLVQYIHLNPVKHGNTNRFDNYPYSSYQSLISMKPTKLKREIVLDWFGGKNEFIKFHQTENDYEKIKNLMLES